MNSAPPNARKNCTAFIHARLIDPASSLDQTGGLVIEDGIITDFGPHLAKNAPDGAEIIDCQGHILSPGLIDMMVFTGEPGHEHLETLATASRAAAAGGVTTMVTMPNTEPVIDDVALVDFISRRARDTAIVNVHVMAAMTKALKGEMMSEIGLLKEAGAIAFTNGLSSVANSGVMRRILDYAKDFDALVAHFPEDPNLAAHAVMNEGEVASRLGLPGQPKVSETIMLERDMALVGLTECRLHVAQISCAESLAILQKAKADKHPVSCGVSINHLALNANDIGPYRTFCKVKPPLRSEEDRRAMAEGIATGAIDVIVSAHDPRDAEVKRLPFADAAYGAIGVETLLATSLRLYHNGEIDLLPLMRAMTINPAKILGLKTGRIAKSMPGDLIVFDPNVPWIIDRNILHSRSKNSAFDEARVQGRVLKTFVSGFCVYHYDKGQANFYAPL